MTQADDLVGRAQAALRAEAWAQAAELLAEAISLGESAPLVHVALGQCLRRLERPAQATPCFKRALALDPDCAPAWVELAVASERAGDLHERERCLRQWLSIRVRRSAPPAPAGAAARAVPDTTPVCVDCRDYALAADALRRTLRQCRFERALLFTDAEASVPGVETLRIPRIASVGEYSRFMIKHLAPHVETAFALIVQYDGYVLNGSRWSDEFLRYDYIGAPWGYGDGMAVGNGGFSLRSRKLLLALQDAEISPQHPEDLAICRTYRPLLEARHGIRFAPPELAARFSFEGQPRRGPTFGFHGVDHLYYLFDMSEAQADAYLPRK